MIDIYQVDAFTDKLFKGNPACVILLDSWLPDEQLLLIAKENAVAETAYLKHSINGYELRWFTPEIEMDLCGHATLASAHVIFKHLNYQHDCLEFSTQSGILKVKRQGKMLQIELPLRDVIPAVLPQELTEGLNITPQEVYKARDYVLVYRNEEEIRQLNPNKESFDRINLDPGGVVVTAKGNSVDFVSRFFTPQASIFEDPVTGSAHCSLIPFWAKRLEKKKLSALQLSEREGSLLCELNKDSVHIMGEARTYLIGKMFL